MSPSHYHHITVLIVLSSYHQGTHCVILLSSGYSLCYHPPTIRVLIVLPSHYHYGTVCYHPTVIGVLIVVSSRYHQDIHGPLSSAAKTPYINVQNRNTRLQASAAVWMRFSLFWVVTQRTLVVTGVSEQPLKMGGSMGCPETSVTNDLRSVTPQEIDDFKPLRVNDT